MEVPARDGKGTRIKAFKEFVLHDGTTIGVFQGSRGKNPDLDIIVRYQQKGKRVRTPRHLHWAIDLLIKKEHEKERTKKFAKYLLDMWDRVEPFRNKGDQQRCELKLTTAEKLREFQGLDIYGEYSVEFIGHVIELLMIQEKNSDRAFMFQGVLESIYNEADIFSIVSSAGYTGR
ncbi:MAG: hypothetical protein HY687_02975 [Chloroflexi bacterium]|nr:hypothetical protein [Chloroflexota bacterium]